jgi:hypothetical protein
VDQRHEPKHRAPGLRLLPLVQLGEQIRHVRSHRPFRMALAGPSPGQSREEGGVGGKASLDVVLGLEARDQVAGATNLAWGATRRGRPPSPRRGA